MSDSQPDLRMLVHQQGQILADMGGIRDDLAVLTAVAMRQDGTLAALLSEVRAMHFEHSRLASRVRDLEAQPS